MGKVIDDMMDILHPKKEKLTKDLSLDLKYGAPRGVWIASNTTYMTTAASQPQYCSTLHVSRKGVYEG